MVEEFEVTVTSTRRFIIRADGKESAARTALDRAQGVQSTIFGRVVSSAEPEHEIENVEPLLDS